MVVLPQLANHVHDLVNLVTLFIGPLFYPRVGTDWNPKGLPPFCGRRDDAYVVYALCSRCCYMSVIGGM